VVVDSCVVVVEELLVAFAAVIFFFSRIEPISIPITRIHTASTTAIIALISFFIICCSFSNGIKTEQAYKLCYGLTYYILIIPYSKNVVLSIE